MINKAILLLNQVPIFKHLMVDELSALSLLAKPHTVKKGSTFHCNAQSIYIVEKGVFGVQKSSESIYLSRTSYFGQLPFCEKSTGVVRALSDASVLEFANTDLYQFIFRSLSSGYRFGASLPRLATLPRKVHSVLYLSNCHGSRSSILFWYHRYNYSPRFY